MKIKSIGLIAASLLVISHQITNTQPISGKVKFRLGIDCLIESNFEPLRNKAISLLTNNAGRTGSGGLTLDAFVAQKVCKIVSVMTPEHGFSTIAPAGEAVRDSELSGLPVYSLYGKNRRPGKNILSGCDAIVVDLQDIGVRSYTYISTLFNVMAAAADFNKEVLVLDRPNPLSGSIVDGNTVDKDMESFVSIVPVSYVHGCTIGELAKMINNEGWLPKYKSGKPRRCRLKIVKMKDYSRSMRWEDTGLQWTATSPNIPSPDAARGYAAIGIFGELGIVGIGIGSRQPFQLISSSRLDYNNILSILKDYYLEGIELTRTSMKNNGSGKLPANHNSLQLKFPLDNNFKPYTGGIKLFLAIRRASPGLFDKKAISDKARSMFCKVTGTPDIFDALFDGGNDSAVLNAASKGLPEYIKTRKKYLMYE